MIQVRRGITPSSPENAYFCGRLKGVKFMCQIDVYIPPQSLGRVVVSTSGERYRACALMLAFCLQRRPLLTSCTNLDNITVLLSLGRADVRSRVIIDGVVCSGDS